MRCDGGCGHVGRDAERHGDEDRGCEAAHRRGRGARRAVELGAVLGLYKQTSP